MKYQITLSVFLFLNTPLKAQEQIDKLFLLSEDVRDVVLKTPGGHPMSKQQFKLSKSEADEMKALAGMDDSTRSYLDSKINSDCNQKTSEISSLEKRVINRNFQIDTMVLTSNAKFEQEAIGRFMSDDYINFMGQLYGSGNKKAWDIYSISTLTSKYKSLNPSVDFDKLTFLEKEKKLSEFANSYLGVSLPSGLVTKEFAFQNMINNGNDWKSTLEAARDRLTTEQKVELVSKIGGTFGNYYNYDRANAGDSARGTYVSTEQLFNSAKAGSPGGICRDIALAQSQMLETLGFKNSYVVAYKTNMGSHATALTTDPVTGKIIKFNYSETTEMKKGSGTEALIQDTSLPDHGLGFRVYDTKGKPVTHVPSQMDQMLRESTGYIVNRDFNQKNYNLVKVGFENETIAGNIFTGKTTNGDNLYGIALFKNERINDNLKLGTGVAISKLSGDRSLMTIDQDNLYMRANVDYTSPSLKLGSTENKIIAGASSELLISNNRETYKGSTYTREAKKELDGMADGYVGVQNKFALNNDRTHVDTKVYANFYPDWDHVAAGNKTIPAFDGVTIQSGVSHQISDDKKALLDTAVIMKNYGSNLVMKAELQDVSNGTRYLAGVSTPLTKDMPTFLPGGEKRLFVGAEKVTRNMVFSVEYERNLDNNSNAVMLRGKVNF